MKFVILTGGYSETVCEDSQEGTLRQFVSTHRRVL